MTATKGEKAMFEYRPSTALNTVIYGFLMGLSFHFGWVVCEKLMRLLG